MKILLFPIALLLIPSTTYSQTIYAATCKVPCAQCSEEPTKIEYTADPKTGVVFRLFGAKDFEKMDDCTVIDKANWICGGSGPMKTYGKQYAVKGTAYWNESSPESQALQERMFGKGYSCFYDKNILGQYKLRKQ